MPLAKCARYDKLFDKVETSICPVCLPDEENDYEKIRAALLDFENLSAEAVAEQAGVALPVVIRMLDQGMLTNTALLGARPNADVVGPPQLARLKSFATRASESSTKISRRRSRESPWPRARMS